MYDTTGKTGVFEVRKRGGDRSGNFKFLCWFPPVSGVGDRGVSCMFPRCFWHPETAYGVSVKGKSQGNRPETAILSRNAAFTTCFPPIFAGFPFHGHRLSCFRCPDTSIFPHVSWLSPIVSQRPKQPNNSPET